MATPSLLFSHALAPLLVGSMFADAAQIHHFSLVDSTNTVALRAAADGAPEGSVFVAEEQTSGRGRGDHGWHSEALTGIYCSVILRPQMPPGDVQFFSLAAGLAVHHAVHQVTGLQADLKWPNDLLLAAGPTEVTAPAKKFCGILAEMSSEMSRVRHVVVGFGMNVNNQVFPHAIAHRATSLRLATGQRWRRTLLAAAVLHQFEREYQQLLQNTPGSRAELIRRFEAHSTMAHGRRVRIVGTASAGLPANELTGITAGLDERGFLRLRTADGTQPVLAGSIEFLDD